MRTSRFSTPVLLTIAVTAITITLIVALVIALTVVGRQHSSITAGDRAAAAADTGAGGSIGADGPASAGDGGAGADNPAPGGGGGNAGAVAQGSDDASTYKKGSGPAQDGGGVGTGAAGGEAARSSSSLTGTIRVMTNEEFMDGKPTPNGEPLDETHCVLVFDQPQTLTGPHGGDSEWTQTDTMLILDDEWCSREGQRITVNDPYLMFPSDARPTGTVGILERYSSIT